MDVVVYHAGSEWARPWEDAFVAGLRHHGLSPEERPQTEPRPCDLAVNWAHRRRDVHEMQRARGAHYLVLERGFVGDRMAWTSCRFDGLNGRGWCPPAPDGGERWRRLFGDIMRPWQDRRYGPIVIMGQVDGDASVRGVDLPGWYRRVASQVTSAWPRRDVRFRPHPLIIEKGGVVFDGLPLIEGSLAEVLDQAAMVITYNSNSGVDAALAGVPTVAMDEGSMAWSVAGHHPLESITPDRHAWAADLAWSQWSLEEIAAGEAWAHLAPGLR